MKDISFVFIVSFVFYNLNKIFINKKRKEIYIDNELIKKNYYFAKKTYRAETVQIIFKSYLLIFCTIFSKDKILVLIIR